MWTRIFYKTLGDGTGIPLALESFVAESLKRNEKCMALNYKAM